MVGREKQRAVKVKALLTVLPGLGLFLGLVLLGPHTQARGGGVLYVALGGECGGRSPCFDNVQAAVDAAQPGDEIRVAAGTYTGVNSYGGLAQVVYISKSVTIRGGYTVTNWSVSDAVAHPTTLDARGQGRVLYVPRGISTTIEGLRITGARAYGLGGWSGWDAGGGVYAISATVTIRNSQVFSNIASSGGGLYLVHSAVTISDNVLSSNTAAEGGGGLYVGEGVAMLSGNTVVSNTAELGGGLILWFSDATLNGNVISYNTANPFNVGQGGGLHLVESDVILSGNTIASNIAKYGGGLHSLGSAITLSGSTLSSNTAYEDGGGLFLIDSTATLSGNTLSSNTARQVGGGLCLLGRGVTLSGNVIISNTAYLDGGGLHVSGSTVTLDDNTLSCNRATFFGGGVSLWFSHATLNGNNVSDNSARDGGGLYVHGSKATLNNNVVAANQAFGAGSGIYIKASSPRLLHTTIARNGSGGLTAGSGGDGSGVYVTEALPWEYPFRGSSVTLVNTILVSQTVGITVTAGNTATLEVTLWGLGAWANTSDWGGEGTIITGTRNYWGDPAFVDPDAGDYHIRSGSAAIDVGVDAGVRIDLDSEPRPYRGYDLGADEYWPPGALKHIYLPLVMRNVLRCARRAAVGEG